MRAKIKVEILLENVKDANLAHIANSVEDASEGSFGRAMWQLGTFADFRVTKVKFKEDEVDDE